MAKSERVVVYVTPEVAASIDRIAQMFGVSQSTAASMLIGSGLNVVESGISAAKAATGEPRLFFHHGAQCPGHDRADATEAACRA